jgi:hypothetical protein
MERRINLEDENVIVPEEMGNQMEMADMMQMAQVGMPQAPTPPGGQPGAPSPAPQQGGFNEG